MQATRARGLEVLEAFSSNMGKRYESGRNYDNGAGNHRAVSMLSPFVSRRLVTEQELVQAAFKAHGPEKAMKFVEEVFWRGYFKGWLELRPTIWSEYLKGLTNDLNVLEKDKRIRASYQAAIDGQTGIDCFDAWSAELKDTGYLHNHARMWFASIWIFTLKLPWRLGADYFYRHLLDGDAASNTLSWRWVAGLHTRGKPYAARADNIATFTGGRFSPSYDELAEVTEGLEATEPEGLPVAGNPRAFQSPAVGVSSLLLITTEDASLQDFDLSGFDIAGCATLNVTDRRSPMPVGSSVRACDEHALLDTVQRLALSPISVSAEGLVDAVRGAGVEQVITPYVTQGPLFDALAESRAQLAQEGIAFTELKRDWDTLIWPHCKAGFFRVKKQIPTVLTALGL